MKNESHHADSYSDCGVIYFGIGQQYLNEAIVSLRSLRRFMPDIPAIMFTRDATELEGFDEVRALPENLLMKLGKIYALQNSPFPRTLFLDTDTYIADSLWELFDLLDDYDVAMALTPFYGIPNATAGGDTVLDGLPISFPIYNSGVMPIAKNDRTDALLQAWWDEYMSREVKAQDQPPLRKVLFSSDVRITTLSPSYNYRFIYPSAIRGSVKIYHGRHHDLENLCDRLNQMGATGWRISAPAPFRKNTTFYHPGFGYWYRWIASRIRRKLGLGN